KNPCDVGFWALRGYNKTLFLRQSARVMTLPPGRPLELVAQLNPGMACRGPATSRFRLSFGSHGVEYTLVALTWILDKDERAIGWRPHQIETCLRGQRRAQVQSLRPSHPKRRRLDDPLACVRPLRNLHYLLGFRNAFAHRQLVALVTQDDLYLFGFLRAGP